MSSNEVLAPITIIQAVYGAVQGSADVRSKVQDLVDRGDINFKADNATLGPDPAKGHDKHFAMTYKVGSSTYSYACKENDMVHVKNYESRGEYTVVGASYGAFDKNNPTGGSYDVTGRVQSMLDAGQTEFKPNNDLFGDPYKGQKNFGMTYFRNGTSTRKVIASNENQTVEVKP
jgi:hypothetical protein